jgi:hypothetical protein
MEMLATFFVVPALVFAYFGLVFGVGQYLSPERIWRSLRSLLPLQLNLWQLMCGVGVAAFLILLFEQGLAFAFTVFAVSLLILGWFVHAWKHEFVFLMGLRDDGFPGRHDKLIWAFLLFAFAPITVWFFRSYRLAHWPEPVAEFHSTPVGESHATAWSENAGTTVTRPAGI